MRESRHDNGGHQKDRLEADLQSSVPWSPPEESPTQPFNTSNNKKSLTFVTF